MNSTSQFSLNILAILLSPLIAVQVTEWIRRRREQSDRRMVVFRTLMTTRGARLAADHVRALNSIDIEFFGRGKRKKAVIEAWRQYHTHLSPQPATDAWIAQGENLFIDLVHAMAICQGYKLGKDEIRRTSYFPSGYGQAEAELARVRTGLAELLENRRALTVQPPAARNPDPSESH